VEAQLAARTASGGLGHQVGLERALVILPGKWVAGGDGSAHWTHKRAHRPMNTQVWPHTHVTPTLTAPYKAVHADRVRGPGSEGRHERRAAGAREARITTPIPRRWDTHARPTPAGNALGLGGVSAAHPLWVVQTGPGGLGPLVVVLGLALGATAGPGAGGTQTSGRQWVHVNAHDLSGPPKTPRGTAGSSGIRGMPIDSAGASNGTHDDRQCVECYAWHLGTELHGTGHST
jgi:hypothetical protein